MPLWRGLAPGGSATVASPLEGTLAPDVDVGHEQDDDEERELDEPEPAERVELHGERVQEHDLDVEDDEKHRREVEADGEALGLHLTQRDAGLEGDPAGPRPPRGPLGEGE